MYICECNKFFDKVDDYKRHGGFCKKYLPIKNFLDNNFRTNKITLFRFNNFVCDCNLSFSNKKYFNKHLFNCNIFKNNNIEKYINTNKLNENNLELTLDEKIKICKEFSSKIIYEKKIRNKSIYKNNKKRIITEETRKKISDTRKEKGLIYNRVKYYSIFNPSINENTKVRGTWELRYALFLNENKINWVNKKKLYYTYNEKSVRYMPDFYLPDLDEYHEVKGKLWTHESDRADDVEKMILVKKYNPNIKIKILMKKDLENLGLNMNKQINYNEHISKIINLPKKKIKEKNKQIKKERKKRNTLIPINYVFYANKKIEIENKILNSNIDFTKYGWIKELSYLINYTPQGTLRWIKQYMFDFYNEKCFKNKYTSIILIGKIQNSKSCDVGS